MVFQNELTESLKANRARTAIECGNKRISYSELLSLSNKVTQFLLGKHLEKETVVGVFLPDKPLLIGAIIGIANARCTFVPIDGTLPEGRLAAMMGELNLQHLITSRDAPEIAPAGSPSLRSYCIEDIVTGEADADLPAHRHPSYGPDDSLYVYFTSGSTGTPKGIVGRNCSLLQFLKWEIDAFGLGPDSRVSQLVSPYFDAFLRDVFAPLLAGGTICVPPADHAFSSEQLTAWIDAARITLIHCVPSVFRVFNHEALSPRHFGHLRHVLLSGERIVPAELLNWYKTFGPRIELVNLYGLTETTMIRAYYRIQPQDAHLARIPIGYPISDTRLLVARQDFLPCPPLVTGDLYIVSDYTAKGYLNDPALTRERFIRLNPGSPQETIAFKTGDKARMLPDGKIDLMGREDRQVKLNGIRVEPDEIESVLFRSQLVKNAFVLKHTEENGVESLIAFVSSKDALPGKARFEEAVLLYLKKHLPGYLVPASVVAVDEFPLLPNGKVNYKELLNGLRTRSVAPPANELERRLLVIWQDILGAKPMSTEESFHSLGGNSLSIMRLLGRIYKEFSVRIPLSAFFSHPTIQKQAWYIERANRDKRFVIERAELKPAYRLSSAQERIYYHYELDKTSTAFNVPVAWELKGDVDPRKVEDVLKRLIERHECLRTEFRFTEGVLGQVVRDTVDFAVEVSDCRGLNKDEAIYAFIRPFDLSRAPLIRCSLIATGNKSQLLVLDIHHIVYDGISQFNLISDFLHLYRGEALQPLPIQYKDYAEWEHAFRATDAYIAQREFWLKNFEGEIPRLSLPTTNAQARSRAAAGGMVFFEMDQALVRAIIEKAGGDGLNTFSVLFSLFFVYMSQITGQEDLIIGTNTSGRTQQELEKLVGMFAKTLPIRRQVPPRASFIAFARAVHQYLIEAGSRQLYDLADIVSELNHGRDVPVKNLVDVMFVFQNMEDRVQPPDGIEFSNYALERTAAKFPLSLFAVEGEEVIVFRLEYESAYFTRADIQLLITQFKSLVDTIAASPEAPIGDCISSHSPVPRPVEDAIDFNF
jgi:amino acid adenylation domain-containing protein